MRVALLVLLLAACDPRHVGVELPNVPGTKSILIAPYAGSTYSRLIAIEPDDEALPSPEEDELRLDVFPSQCTLAELGLDKRTYTPSASGEPLVHARCVFSIDLAPPIGPLTWTRAPTIPSAARAFHLERGAPTCPSALLNASCE